MQEDEQPAPSPDPKPRQEQASEEARDNLEVQKEAAKEREDSRGYQ